MVKEKILPIFIPFAGCPHRCTYCNQSAITGIGNENSLLKSVTDQISEWLPRLNSVSEIAFYGGTFTRLPSDIRKLMYEAAHPYNIRISTCPDSVRADFQGEIKKYNITTVELGVQSLSDTVLSANKRMYTAKDVLDVFAMLGRQVKKSAQFMVGMYTEEREDLLDTARLIPSLDAEYSRIYPTMVLKNTELEEHYNNKIYKPLSPLESILRTGYLYVVLNSCGSRVIRVGLPPEIGNDNVIAGYWHPAFGDIIKTFTIALFACKYNKLPDINYSGYKSFIKNNFKYPVYSGVDNMQKVSEKLLEQYRENNQWFIEEQSVAVASGLISQTDI